LTKATVFAELDKDYGFNADDFLLWIQARYALDQLSNHAPNGLIEQLRIRAARLERPGGDHFLFGWADDFLPAWVRFCWRAELVPCAGFQPHQLRLEIEDLHIPWNIAAVVRPDLSAAAILLCKLPPDGGAWNATQFPGALYNGSVQRLVLPFPTWGSPNELAALNPLMRALERDAAFVTQLDVLPVGPDISGLAATPALVQQIKEMLAGVTRVPQFANPDRIGVATDLINVS
jgi:hypothetical protein